MRSPSPSAARPLRGGRMALGRGRAHEPLRADAQRPRSRRHVVQARLRPAARARGERGAARRARAVPTACRCAAPAAADIEAVVRLDLVLPEYQAGSPVFSRGPVPAPADVRADWEEELADPTFGIFLADVDGQTVGTAVGAPASVSSAHSGLARPEGAAVLGYAATLPEYRGRGVGMALTEAVFEWARKAGYSTVVVDWRETNLLSSRFWPNRGFRRTFVRLYRSIP